MMKSVLRFLIAARQGEITELQQFASAMALTHLLGLLVHALQRERGASNIWLTSEGALFAAERAEFIAHSDAAMAEVRGFFDGLDTAASFASSSRARLFNRIAYALHGLQALQGLRSQVASGDMAATEMVSAYTQLIASLLAVVFEAADSATDVDIARQLVAYFNFIQCKELAAQERAIGVSILGQGMASAQQPLLNVIDGQERALQTFGHFCEAGLLSVWHAQEVRPYNAELERLRSMLLKKGAKAEPSLQQEAMGTAPAAQGGASVAWFACCTERINAMKDMEDRLIGQLLQLSEAKIAQAVQDLTQSEAQLQQLMANAHHNSESNTTDSAGSALFSAGFNPSAAVMAKAVPGLMAGSHMSLGPHIERATLELLQEQQQRLQAVSDELEQTKAILHERKFIDRAKGLLMQHRQVSEEQAYKMMREMAMQQNRRLIDVAKSVLALESYLRSD